MRETRPYGSEGGGQDALPTPIRTSESPGTTVKPELDARLRGHDSWEPVVLMTINNTLP
jgi:hypothetical protein